MFVAVATNTLMMTGQKNGESLVFDGSNGPLNPLWNHFRPDFLLIK